MQHATVQKKKQQLGLVVDIKQSKLTRVTMADKRMQQMTMQQTRYMFKQTQSLSNDSA